MIHLQTTMIISSSQLLQLSKRFRVINEDLVVLSLAMLLFIEIEKATIEGCFKIIWRIIQRTDHIYSVGGLWSFTFDCPVLCT